MHQWQFFRAGGVSQVSLSRGADFAALPSLDQTLWVALACPVDGIEFDRETLALLDADGDGRIRAAELLGAIDWTLQRLKDPSELLAADAALPLAAIDTTHPGGAAIAAAAERVLRETGHPGESAIGLAAASAAAGILATRALNGDGVVTPASTEDPGLRSTLEAAIAAGFGVPDRSGDAGIDAAGAEAFFAATAAALAWRREGVSDPAVLPLGAASAAALSATDAIAARIDDYFARCALARFDPRAEAALNREEQAWLALAARDLSIETDEIRTFPLARVGARRELPLGEEVNPAWAAALARFVSEALEPLSGRRETLAEADWQALKERLAPCRNWLARKPAAALEALSDEALGEHGSEARRAALSALIAADAALAPAYDALTDLVNLVRLRRDLAPFCRNFVNFQDFYGARHPASFQFGTLYIDQRSCRLCLKVSDAGKHAAIAGLAGACLVYCECRRAGSGETLQIVAAVTAGDSDNLMVGRNGVFYDRSGRDWDATVTRIVDSPVSVRQAFWSPYRKLARFVEEQVAKRAAAADTAGNEKLQAVVVNAPQAVAEAAPAEARPAAPARRIDVGTVAALGVALGSLGTAFGYFLRTVAEIRAWQFPLLLLGIMLAISGPSMILAWLKLRRRNVAPLLDASGWAVNARALVNLPFGSTLTTLAALPADARIGGDTFAAHGSSAGRLLVAAFLIGWALAFAGDMGWLQGLGSLLP